MRKSKTISPGAFNSPTSSSRRFSCTSRTRQKSRASPPPLRCGCGGPASNPHRRSRCRSIPAAATASRQNTSRSPADAGDGGPDFSRRGFQTDAVRSGNNRASGVLGIAGLDPFYGQQGSGIAPGCFYNLLLAFDQNALDGPAAVHEVLGYDGFDAFIHTDHGIAQPLGQGPADGRVAPE